VYIAAFTLLTVAGAFGAWHSNPAYSTRQMLRQIAIAFLGIAAAFAAMLFTADHADHGPKSVALASIVGLSVLFTFCLIWLVVTASRAESRVVPVTSKLVTIHRRKLIPWVVRIGSLVLGFGFLSLALPGNGKIVAYAIGGLTVALGIVFLLAGYFTALSFDRALTAVESDPWVHWRYTPDEWKAWDVAEVARLAALPPRWIWRRDWKHFLKSYAVLAAVVFALNARTVPWQWNTGVVAAAGLAMFCVIAVSQRLAKTAPYRLRRLLTSAAPEAYFGDAGVYADGTFIEWQTVGCSLIDASLDERSPRSLSFFFQKHAITTADPIAYVTGSGTSMIDVHKNVLIPPDADAAIAVLQTKVAAACPNAHIAFIASPHSGELSCV
jgi:hypothetical protein